MNRKKLIFVLVIGLWLYSVPTGASWIWELAVWNSPYQQNQIYSTELSYTWKPNNFWHAQLTLAGQFFPGQANSKPDCFHPRASFAYVPDLADNLRGKFGLDYHPRGNRFQLEAGLETLADPLLASCSIQSDGQESYLNLGLVFAANERWALGTHLRYAKNSLFTFQVHHSQTSKIYQTISYGQSLDGSLQYLSLKITF